MRRPITILAACLLALAIAIGACGSDEESGGPGAAPSPGAPAVPIAFAKIDTAAGQLYDGGTKAFEEQLAALEGHPVVVNQWASWCGPCRFEFPFFGAMAKKYKGQVAFLGVNSQDTRSGAREFIADLPVPFPHFYDPDTKVARTFRGGRAFPSTAFYDARGELVQTHAGVYPSAADLEADIKKYAMKG